MTLLAPRHLEDTPPPYPPLSVRLLELVATTAVTVITTKIVEWAYARLTADKEGVE